MSKFSDPNLQLLVLDQMWTDKLLPKFDKEKFYKQKLKKEYSRAEDYNYEIDKKVLAALLAIELPASKLAKLNRIWYGGNEVHQVVWTNFDGQSEKFYVRSLDGIEACKNLESITFDPGVAFSDLSPLTSLAKLADLTLVGKPLANLQPLTELPKLKKLRVSRKKSAKNDKVIAELIEKGVKVDDVVS